MKRYLNFVFKYPLLILIALFAITFFFYISIANLSEDNNPFFLPETHPARSAIYEMREEFTGAYDAILVAFYNKNGVFNPATINAIFELTEKSKAMNFVDETDVERLVSIRDRNIANPRFVNGINAILADGLTQSDGDKARELYLESANWSISRDDRKFIKVVAERTDPIREMAGMAATENIALSEDGTIIAQETVNNYDQDLNFVKNAIMNNELFEDGFIDKDGTVALIVVELSLLDDDAYGQVRSYEAFKSMVADYQAEHPELKDEIYVGGVPVFFAAQKQVIDHDFAILLPLVLLLIGLVLAVFFRTVLGVVLPLLNVVMCTIWTLGMMAIAKMPLDLITSILPVFLITICSSDAIHMMAEYYHQKNITKERSLAMRRALVLMASPVILTTIATCATFMVSTSTSIESLRNFGMLVSFGMFVALIISLLLIPAVLALFKGKPLKDTIQHHSGSLAKDERIVAKNYFISRLLLFALRPVIHNRRLYSGLFLALLVAAASTASQVNVDDMGSGYFAKDSAFRIADEFINEHVAGTSPGWIEIDSGEKNGALSTAMINFVDDLERFIHELPHVTFSYSAARYIRRVNYTLNDFKPEYNRLPYEEEVFIDIDEDTGEEFTTKVSGSEIARQCVLMYENGGGTDITNVFNDEFSKTMILYTLGTTVANDYKEFLGPLSEWLAHNTPEGYKIKLAGTPVIWTTVLDALIDSQTVSLFLAMLTVIIVMGGWLRSVRLGIAGTLPLITTVVCYFALMAILDIELNIGTSIISFLVLGIVDYSVHYILRIQIELNNGMAVDNALEAAIEVSGRAIVANILVFSIGFVALLFSDFKPLVDLGTLIGLSLLISGVMTLFIVTLFAPWFFAKHTMHTVDNTHGMGRDMKLLSPKTSM